MEVNGDRTRAARSGDVQFMVDDGHAKDEILKAERFILGMLEFDQGWMAWSPQLPSSKRGGTGE